MVLPRERIIRFFGKDYRSDAPVWRGCARGNTADSIQLNTGTSLAPKPRTSETGMNDDADRVRRHTAAEVLRRIDDATVARLASCADSPAETDRRLAELEREWDIDRVLETEAATMGLLGLALGTFVRKQLLALPAIVAAAVLLQATTGRYPLMPLFRRLGLRTSKEIARERYAVKALRGDFAGMGTTSAAAAALSGEQRAEPQASDDESRSGLH